MNSESAVYQRCMISSTLFSPAALGMDCIDEVLFVGVSVLCVGVGDPSFLGGCRAPL